MMETVIKNIPAQIKVQVVKQGLFKRSYLFVMDDKIIGQLDYAASYNQKAIVFIENKELSICRKGFWKQYIEIVSVHPVYNRRIDINWSNKIKITDLSRNNYSFKPTSIWRNKWAWFDERERPVIEIKSKVFSKQNRGSIEIKDPVMKDWLLWIVVSWFVILCSESDAAVVAGI